MSIDPEKVFAPVEDDRASGELSKRVTTAKVTYQSSESHPGYIEQIDKETFANSAVTPLEVENLQYRC